MCARAWNAGDQTALDQAVAIRKLFDGKALVPGVKALLAHIHGDPALARHARSLVRVTSAPVIERLDLPGPLCLGKGIEITLHVDEGPLSGGSVLLLSALLARLFARHASINSFVRTRTRLQQKQEEVTWPMALGNRDLI